MWRSGTTFLSIAVASLLGGQMTTIAAAVACGEERYFPASDLHNTMPLARPSAELADLRRRAAKGDAVAQRSIAIGYETGYLVSQCADKALYWYRQAGRNGDRQAQDWLAGRVHLQQMSQGPECVGPRCFGEAVGSLRTLALVANPDSHFYAPVTVNGVTFNGMIDTGATTILMSAHAARSMGIAWQKGRAATSITANGSMPIQIVTVDAVTVGGIALRDIDVSVSEADTPLLIGMSFLRRLNVEIHGSNMMLTVR